MGRVVPLRSVANPIATRGPTRLGVRPLGRVVALCLAHYGRARDHWRAHFVVNVRLFFVFADAPSSPFNLGDSWHIAGLILRTLLRSPFNLGDS